MGMKRKHHVTPVSSGLEDKQRRNKDIYEFVTGLQNVKLGGKHLYKYQAILFMAQEEFYLAPDTIADIVRDYAPVNPEPDPEPDPAQTSLFE